MGLLRLETGGSVSVSINISVVYGVYIDGDCSSAQRAGRFAGGAARQPRETLVKCSVPVGEQFNEAKTTKPLEAADSTVGSIEA